jgi:hypothetical protein
VKQIRLWIRPKGVYPLPPTLQPAENAQQHEKLLQTQASASAAQAVASDDPAAMLVGGDGADGSHLILNHKHRSSHWKAAKKAKKKAAAAAAAAASGEPVADSPPLQPDLISLARPSRFQFGCVEQSSLTSMSGMLHVSISRQSI